MAGFSKARLSLLKTGGWVFILPILLVALLVFGFQDRLRNYVVLLRIDPIFSLTGADIPLLLTAVDGYERTKRTLEPFYANTTSASVIRDRLYPVRFLQSLAELEKKRRSLVNKPTLLSTLSYHLALERTYAAHRDSISSSVEILDKAENRTLGYLFGKMTIEEAKEKLLALKEDAEDARERARARLICLFIGLPVCEESKEVRVDIAYGLVTRKTGTPRAWETVPIFAEYLRIRKDRPHGSAPSDGFVELLPPSCASSNEPMPYVVWFRDRFRESPGLLNMQATFLDTLYFRDNTAEPNTPAGSINDGLTSALKERGLRYVFQATGSLYICPDALSEQARAASLLYIRKELKERPLLARPEDPVLANMRAWEDLIREEKPLKESTIKRYLFLLAAYITLHGEDSLLTEKEIQRAEDLISVYEEGSGYFEHVVSTAVDMSDLLTPLLTLGKAPEPASILLTRGGVDALLLMQNRSVTQGRRFLEPGAERYGAETQLFPYTELPLGNLFHTELAEYLREESDRYRLFINKIDPF